MTKTGANLFQELGFAPDEAARFQATEILMVSRPRVSDVVNMKVSKFTIDTLVNMLSRVGKPVRLVIG